MCIRDSYYSSHDDILIVFHNTDEDSYVELTRGGEYNTSTILGETFTWFTGHDDSYNVVMVSIYEDRVELFDMTNGLIMKLF